MKVKDLRDYLSLHDTSTEMCREKEELVFLVLGQQPVISQEGRTRAPTSSADVPEQQAFLTQPRASTVPPTSPHLASSSAQATSVPPAQAQETQQVCTGSRLPPAGQGAQRVSCSLCASGHEAKCPFCLLMQACFLDIKPRFCFFQRR